MAGGHADDLATTVLLATDKPVLVAPAMNPRMWLHPATQRNVAQLQADGIRFVGPNVGEMAERGEAGPGRLAEVPEIMAAADKILAERREVPVARLVGRPLAGRHVLITSGPTHEPIDPVRYIANRSSGKQGHAIARAAAALGARVTLVSGPVSLPDPAGVEVVRVETAEEMLRAVQTSLPADIAVFAAAVADWRSASAPRDKIKKSGDNPSLDLIENPDILASVGKASAGRPALVIGFAAETGNVTSEASEEAQVQGRRLDRRQRRLAGARCLRRRRQHRAHRHGRRYRGLAHAEQGRGGAAPDAARRRVSAARRGGSRMTAKRLATQSTAACASTSCGSSMAPGCRCRHTRRRAPPGSICWRRDVQRPMTLAPGARALVPTGLVLELPAGYEAQVRPRSGLALKNGVTVLNSPGTIDSDYRGEVSVILVNLGQAPFEIRRGERIAQLVVSPVSRAALVEAADVSETARGAGGFGSTGKTAPNENDRSRKPAPPKKSIPTPAPAAKKARSAKPPPANVDRCGTLTAIGFRSTCAGNG